MRCSWAQYDGLFPADRGWRTKAARRYSADAASESLPDMPTRRMCASFLLRVIDDASPISACFGGKKAKHFDETVLEIALEVLDIDRSRFDTILATARAGKLKRFYARDLIRRD